MEDAGANLCRMSFRSAQFAQVSCLAEFSGDKDCHGIWGLWSFHAWEGLIASKISSYAKSNFLSDFIGF
jgi:hypothetical protein